MKKPYDDMNILSLDTTLNRCSVAVLADDAVLAHEAQDLRRGHAEALMPMIQAALATAGLTFEALDLVAVTTGPGTFTGQRVGLSAARGIGVATGLPVQGVGTMSAIALAAKNANPGRDILVVLDARRGEFYVQHFPDNSPVWPDHSAPRAIPTDQLSEFLPDVPCVLTGTGVTMAMEILGEENPAVVFSTTAAEADAIEVARLASGMVADQGMPTEPPAPLYLRAPDAKLPGGKSL